MKTKIINKFRLFLEYFWKSVRLNEKKKLVDYRTLRVIQRCILFRLMKLKIPKSIFFLIFLFTFSKA